MTLEMGKPIGAARAEAAKCALACRYYAEHGERLLADEPLDAGAGTSYLKFQSIGPVLAVMPWNFPFWQVFRFAAPSLMAGNVGLLKHASNVPQCALEIEDVIRRAGFPDGAFQTLLIGSAQVARVIDDPRVKAASLTGSEPAGAQVAAQAGRQLKKTVLELGGSDPFVVMPSADLVRAVRTAVDARVINNGQSCIAAKRFLVVSASPPISSGASSKPCGRCASATRWTSLRNSVRWPLPRFSKASTSRCALPSRRARACSPAGIVSTGPEISTRPPSWPMCPQEFAGLPRGAVRTGGRAVPHAAASTKRSTSPTTPISVWAPACGPTTRRAAPLDRRDRSRHGLR